MRTGNRLPRERTWATAARMEGAPSTATVHARAPMLMEAEPDHVALYESIRSTAQQQHELLMELEPADTAGKTGAVPLAKDTAFMLEVVSLGWAAERGRTRPAPVGSMPPAQLAAWATLPDDKRRDGDVGRADAASVELTASKLRPVELTQTADLGVDPVYQLPVEGVSQESAAPSKQTSGSRMLQEDVEADEMILALADASSMPLTMSVVGNKFNVQDAVSYTHSPSPRDS